VVAVRERRYGTMSVEVPSSVKVKGPAAMCGDSQKSTPRELSGVAAT
jgi:hypothetical protein